MEDPFKDFDQDLTHLPHAAMNGDAKDAAQPKKRGAPKGNQNARKHGFYSNRIPAHLQEAFEEARRTDLLDEEIALLRVKIVALMEEPQGDTRLLLYAMWTLARLLRIDDRVRFGS